MMVSFDYQPRTRIVFGRGRIDTLGELAGEMGIRRALIVTDAGIRAAGHCARAEAAFERARIAWEVFDRVCENPTTDTVADGLAVARRFEPELLVGLGGGSAMDASKGVNFLYSNGGTMPDYWGVGKATRPMLPMIAAPTTSGTGSETQSFALISDARTRVKMACGDKKASFRIALLDPELTLSQPARVTALTGIDALAHAVETYVTKGRNPVSLAFSREAWLLLGENFGRVLDNPRDLEARSGMQLGAAFAGLAIENSMLGAAHAAANPLTSRYGVVHGQAVGIMLPHVIRHNGQRVALWYQDLLEGTSGAQGFPRPESGYLGLAEFVAELASKAGLPLQLSDCGVQRDALPALAAEAARQWTASFNPRPMQEADFLALYEAAFEPSV